MKKILAGFVFLFLIFAQVQSVQAQGVQNTGGERIISYDVAIRVNNDAIVNVDEEIVYDFGSQEKHGILHNITTGFRGNDQALPIEIFNVRVDGHPFTVSRTGSSSGIKIGDPEKFVRGVVSYNIHYSVKRAIGYYDTFDEIYWNAIGADWNVPIENTRVRVVLPEAVDRESLRISCYQGQQGSRELCGSSVSGERSASIDFTSRSLRPREGLTVAVGFPKEIVASPSQAERILVFVQKYWPIILPIIAFIVMFRLWYKKGRDPRGTGTIIPEYDAPDNLTPLEMSFVLNQGVKNKDISSEIIYLATKGFIKVIRISEKKLLFNTTDYTLVLLKSPDDLQNNFDKKLLLALFSPALVGTEVKLSSLKNQFYMELPPIKKSVSDSVVAKEYYPADPQKVIRKYAGFGILLPVAIGFTVGFFAIAKSSDAILVVSIIASALIVVGFSAVMPAVTKKGALMREKIKGLKMYISVAEKDRINFHNAPEKSPELFEKLLPFAMMLGVETAWAKQFEDIYTTPPQWYSDTSGGAFNAVVFAHSVSSFSSAASSTLASAPGGHSGSGGGGFSGGGGGGGGGGSW